MRHHTQLKTLREKKGFNQTEFAKIIGMRSQEFLSQVELGKSKLPAKYVEKTCEVLGVTRDELFAEPVEDIKKEYVEIAFDIVSSVDSKDLTSKQRSKRLETVYNWVKSLLDKNLTVQELEDELAFLKVELEMRENFIERIMQLITEKKKNAEQ